MDQIENVICDKCGQAVAAANDAAQFDTILADNDWIPPLSFCQVFVKHRHLLPTENCVGSPSRAQYIKGQPRATKYPYVPENEINFRNAFLLLTTSTKRATQ